jgi:hypothetical protein
VTLGKSFEENPRRVSQKGFIARAIHHGIQESLCVWLLEEDARERFLAVLGEVRAISVPFDELDEDWSRVFHDIAKTIRMGLVERDRASGIAPPESVKKEKKESEKKEKVEKDAHSPELRRRIFDAWSEAFGREKCRFRSAGKRDRSIIARLNEGFSEEQIVQGIQGFAKDSWRHEMPVRHELATLLKSGDHLETGIETFNGGGSDAGRKAGRNTGASGRAGNGTIDFEDKDRERGSAVLDIRGNPVRREPSKWPGLSGDSPVGDELL